MLFVLATVLPSPAADSEALLRQADRYVLDGKTNLALTTYLKVLQAGVPLQSDFARARNIGLCYLNGTPHDFPQAAVWLENALRVRSDADDVRFNYAQALAWSHSYGAAAVQYRALLDHHPRNSEYALGLVNVYFWDGRPELGFSIFQDFLERDPSNKAVRLEYARMLSFAKRFPDAMRQYQSVLNDDPSNQVGQLGVARVTSWQGDLAAALDLYNRFLRQHPTVYDAQVGKAFTLMWMGNKDEARTLFEALATRNRADKEVATALESLGPRPVEPMKLATPGVTAPQPTAPTADEVAGTLAKQVEAAPVIAPDPEAEIRELALKAESAANNGNYTEAVHYYHQVLERNPQQIAAAIQIARVLSWSKAYDASVLQYDELLRRHPAEVMVSVERARVLSWSRKFDESISGYQAALRTIEQTPAASLPPEIKPDDVRLEYARVLSWATRYDECLAEIARLLPADARPRLKDVSVLVLRGRVLSYSRRYQESVESYDQALTLQPKENEARLGKAQAMYWSGNLDAAASVLRRLVLDEPKDPDAGFTLAAVEHGLGRDGRALALLAPLAGTADTKVLRESILKNLRPALSARIGFEDDVESPTSSPPTSTRGLRYTASVEFNITPDWRLEVSNTVTRGVTSNATLGALGGPAIATDTLVRFHVRPRSWLQLAFGAGVGTTGGGQSGGASFDRRQHAIYDVHPTIARGPWRIDATATRRAADYTPLAIHDNVVLRRESVAVSYNWNKRMTVGGEYWRGDYSIDVPTLPSGVFNTGANGGSAFVTPTWLRREHFTVDAGMRYEIFQFDNSAARIPGTSVPAVPVTAPGSAGFFAPHLYQRYSGTGHASWEPNQHVHVDVGGTFGPQRVFSFDPAAPPATFGTTGSASSQVSFNVGEWHPYIAYDYFNTATPGAPGLQQGSYLSHAVSVGFTVRF
jgi:tetratricopeptide (TPR) repeat protein